MTVNADTRELKRFEKDLIKLNKRGIPYAVKGTLNSLAFDARSEWQEGLRKEFTLRNKFTESSIRVEKARGLDMRSMESRVGSIAPYMATQEDGGTIRGKGGNKAIPVDSARTGKSHKRMVARPNRMSKIKLGPRNGKTQRQRNAIQIAQAKTSGSKYAYLEVGRKRGIFRVKGGKRKTKLELIQTLSQRAARIPPRPTMERAVTKASSNTMKHYRKALVFQLEQARTWKR